MPVWLVTGGSGFLGGHLLSALAERRMPGVEVMALGRRLPANWPGEAFLRADLNDPSSLRRVLAATEPAVVFHTAGRTPPADPETLYLANTLATLHLLDALRALPKTTRLVLAGSAAELGPVPVEDLPVGEDYPCRPGDAYGLSKWLASTAGLAARPPLEVIVARVFNPVGPGQPASQALGRFADLLERSRSGPPPPDRRRPRRPARFHRRPRRGPGPHRPGTPRASRPGLSRRHGTFASRARRARPADRAERPQGRGRGRSAPVPGARARRLAGRSHQAHDAHGLASGNRVGAKPCGPLG